MRKNGLKQRLFSMALAVSIAVSSISVTPPVQVYAEKGEGTVYASRTFDSNYDAQNAYSGNDLGCTYTKEKTTFKVWSPEASSIKLCRYTAGKGGSVIEEVDMTKGDKGVWSATINGDIVNTYYTYKVTVNGKTNEAVDIYAKAAGVNGDRAMVVDLDSTDPENWDTDYQREATKLSDIVVWEVHVRDFSIDVSSGVSKENRGKYKAFTEDTTINGEGKVASCVNYLKELGVTHVQILPMYDYASVDEENVSTDLSSNYNWGYDPENYNVPEGSYSSDPTDGNVRIREMKEMIQALHDAGIKVIMDVVYNHTYDTADSNFTKIMPDYYYKINSDLSYNNQSGCGNATRSESAMYRKFMIDSLTYWADEYNLDGFRFDLMGIHDVTTMNQIRSTLDEKFGEDTIVLYGEGWTGDGSYDGNSAHKANEAKLNDGIGYFNDQIRDALKGEHKFDGTIGLLQTNYFSGTYLDPGEKWPNNVFAGIMGSVGFTAGQWGMWRPFWSKSSNCSLSYVSAHDNLTLWDKLTEGFGKNYSSTDEKLIKMNKMAGGIVLSSKGGVFMQAGEEFARTKNGDENSYKSPDSANKIDWNRVNTYSDIQKYYQGMIAIRKAFSGFRSITTRSGDNWNPNNNNLTWINKDASGFTGFYETNDVAGEWNRIAVLINNATMDTTVNLTGSTNWVIIADGKTAGLEKIKETGSSVTVSGKSVMIAVPKDTFEANNVQNKAPEITAENSYETSVGTPLSFQVKATDADGDAVTLTVKDLPTGASFDVSTGNFTWSSPAAGTYTITVTASDGKASSTKNIKITVTEKTTALKNYVAAVEAEGLKEQEFTAAVWTPFASALSEAKQIIAASETDEVKIGQALENLKKAYEGLSAEKEGRTSLEKAVSDSNTRIAEAKADAANYDAEAVADLETVIAEANEFLASPAESSAYESLIEDVTAAMNAVVSLKANPVIRVKADGWSTPAIWVWNEASQENYTQSQKWPGDKLTAKDADGWYVYDLPKGVTGYSVIINDGAAGTTTQTSDITGISESVDITVTSFTGKPCTYTKAEKPLGQGTVTVTKELLENVITKAAAYEGKESEYTLESYTKFSTALSKAEEVKADSKTTQVLVNQAVRGLKRAINDLEFAGNITPTSVPTITPTEIPTLTPSITPIITPTEIPTLTPSVTPIITPTNVPIEHDVMNLSFGGKEILIELENNSASNHLKELLPLGLYFDECNGVEKISYIETVLDTSNAPESCTPEAGTLAYYIPWGNICLFYGSMEETAGLVPLGKVIKGLEYVTELDLAGEISVNLTGEVVTPVPTLTPSAEPTPTDEPTTTPIVTPPTTITPTTTIIPTSTPTQKPTVIPTKVPTKAPTVVPTKKPAATATTMPTKKPVPTKAADFSLTASVRYTTDVRLKWNKVDGADCYKVYRATSKNGTYKRVTSIYDGSKTYYTDKKLKCGKNYYYYVKAYDEKSGKLVAIDTTAKKKIKPLPAKVTLSSVKYLKDKRIKVTWKKLKNVSGYAVYQSNSKNGTYKKVAVLKGSSKTTYINKKVTSNKKYYYKIKAYKNVNGKKVYGSYSNVKYSKAR